MSDRIWIGVDGNEGNVAQRVGSNVYAFELLSSLAERVKHPQSRLAVRVFLAQPPQPDWPEPSEFWQYTVVGNAPFWTLTKLPRDLSGFPELTLFYSPGHYTPAWCPVPVVCSVMDLGYEHFPEQFKAKDRWQLTLLTRWSVRQSRHVIAISQATKKDLMAVYRVSEKKISVVYPGQPKGELLSETQVKKRRAALNLPAKYILYVGTLQPRKNLIRLIQAFELLAESDSETDLVIVGRAGWLSDPIVSAMKSSPQAHRIHHLGFLSQEDKQAVLQGAKVLTLVGLLEGFGIPPLEAIRSGVVPVVSRAASLPEVVGPEGELVDPLDSADIARGIKNVLEWSRDRYEHEVAELQRHAEQFSWTNSAARLEKILLNVVEAETK